MKNIKQKKIQKIHFMRFKIMLLIKVIFLKIKNFKLIKKFLIKKRKILKYNAKSVIIQTEVILFKFSIR